MPGLPAELLARLGRVADELVDLGWPEKRGIGHDVAVVIEPDMGEGDFEEVAHRVGFARGDNVVVRFVLLQHQPHRLHVIAGVAPVTLRVEIAEPQLVGKPQLDPGDSVADLARDELQPSAGRFVVKQDSSRRVQAIRLPIVDGDVVAVRLRNAVGRARVEGRSLVLRNFPHLAEHLRRGRLVEADVWIDRADCLEHARHADARELGREHWLVPRGRYEALRGEVVDLVRLRRLQRRHQRGRVEQVALEQVDAVDDVPDALDVLRRRTPRHPEHLVIFFQQELREIRAVLARNPGDQRSTTRHRRHPI